jgi:hypothetical protein
MVRHLSLLQGACGNGMHLLFRPFAPNEASACGLPFEAADAAGRL